MGHPHKDGGWLAASMPGATPHSARLPRWHVAAATRPPASHLWHQQPGTSPAAVGQPPASRQCYRRMCRHRHVRAPYRCAACRPHHRRISPVSCAMRQPGLHHGHWRRHISGTAAVRKGRHRHHHPSWYWGSGAGNTSPPHMSASASNARVHHNCKQASAPLPG